MVRYDVQQLATDVHMALGLEERPAPPPVTTRAPITSTAWPNSTIFPGWSTTAPLSTDWPTTTALPDTSLLPPSTTAAPPPTMQPPVSTITTAQSTSLAPPSSSTAQPGTTAAPQTSTATPASTAAPTTTGAVTTSSAPTTPQATTAAPGDCSNPQMLDFSGIDGTDVGVQGPFNFTGWTYDYATTSDPPTYGQSIFSDQTNTQVIAVTDPNGILLCAIAASGKGASTPATFIGYTLGGTNVSTTEQLPGWQNYVTVNMTTNWQPLQSITIVTAGPPEYCSTELWEIAYQYLGPT